MNHINPQILDFLKTQRVGVLAVEMMDGSPHGATIHFAHTEEPLVFYFETQKDYRKTEALYGRATSRASFVIGAHEASKQTMQLDGEVRLLKPEETAAFNELYFGKFPTKKEKMDAPNVVLFQFTPIWWRFTDWTTPAGKRMFTSE